MSAVADSTRAGFTEVDADPDVAGLVAALDEQAADPAVRRLRAAALRLLDARPGDHLLDLGCGTGETTRALAAAVAPTGSAVGIDASERMLREAVRRTPSPAVGIDYRPGDVNGLSQPDASVDGVYCERVLQHVADPDAAVAEIGRVTRPSGRVVLVDADWGMHAIHGGDPVATAAIVEGWTRATATGWVGRRLPSLLLDAGFCEPTVVAETLVRTSAPPGTPTPFAAMAAAAVESAVVGEHDARRWLADLADAHERGRLFWAVTMFAVGARRPG